MITLVLLFASFSLVGSASGTIFSDVDINFWGHDAIYDAVSKGYVNGFGDGTFQPFEKVTREQFVKMLIVALGYDLYQVEDNLFKDVKEDHWAAPYIKTAIVEGLIHPAEYGYTFNGSEPITREEMVNMMVRALEGDKEGKLYEAVKMGLIKGYEDGTIRPEGLTNRTESVVMVERTLTTEEGGTLEADKQMQERIEVETFGSNGETMTGFPFIKLPITIDMGGYDAIIEKILVYDETNPNTEYYHMFEHAEGFAESTYGTHYKLAFFIKGVNKTDLPYNVDLEGIWTLDSGGRVSWEDGEIYGYTPFRFTLPPKSENGGIREGILLLGLDKAELNKMKRILMKLETPKGTIWMDLIDDKRVEK